MKIILNSKQLLEKLRYISPLVSANTALPILDCFLFELEGNTLTIMASDLDNTITTSMEVETNETMGFKIAVSSKILLETLKSLPSQTLQFFVYDNKILEIVSESGKYNLPYFNGAEFPKPKEVLDITPILINSKILVSAISKTIFATANDDLRPSLTGVFFEIKSDRINFVATDTLRLVKYSLTNVKNEIQGEFIVPKKPLTVIKGILEKFDEIVSIDYNQTHAVFTLGDYKISCRLIDGRFPKYEAVIPKNNPNKLRINRLSLLNVVKRVNIFSDKTTHRIKLNIADTKLKISSEDKNTSSRADEKLTCFYEGENMEIGFNSRFLAEMLSNISSEEIEIEMSQPNRAGLLKPIDGLEENEEVLMLVMPVLITG